MVEVNALVAELVDTPFFPFFYATIYSISDESWLLQWLHGFFLAYFCYHFLWGIFFSTCTRMALAFAPGPLSWVPHSTILLISGSLFLPASWGTFGWLGLVSSTRVPGVRQGPYVLSCPDGFDHEMLVSWPSTNTTIFLVYWCFLPSSWHFPIPHFWQMPALVARLSLLCWEEFISTFLVDQSTHFHLFNTNRLIVDWFDF